MGSLQGLYGAKKANLMSKMAQNDHEKKVKWQTRWAVKSNRENTFFSHVMNTSEKYSLGEIQALLDGIFEVFV